jgi:hypothetical protein
MNDKDFKRLFVSTMSVGVLIAAVFIMGQIVGKNDIYNKPIKEKIKMSDSVSEIKELEKQKKSNAVPYGVYVASLASISFILSAYKNKSTR